MNGPAMLMSFPPSRIRNVRYFMPEEKPQNCYNNFLVFQKRKLLKSERPIRLFHRSGAYKESQVYAAVHFTQLEIPNQCFSKPGLAF